MKGLFTTLSIKTLWHYAECSIFFVAVLSAILLSVVMLSVFTLTVVMLSVTFFAPMLSVTFFLPMLSVIMLGDIKLNVILCSVMAPVSSRL